MRTRVAVVVLSAAVLVTVGAMAWRGTFLRFASAVPRVSRPRLSDSQLPPVVAPDQPAPAAAAVALIADDACAVMLTLTVRLTDERLPLEDGEVWQIEKPRLVPPEPTWARLLGKTNEQGEFATPYCYLGTSEFVAWRPDVDPVSVELLIVREGYGSRRLVLTPPTEAVLARGSLLYNQPGDRSGPQTLKFREDSRHRTYVLEIDANLQRVRGPS